VSSRALIGLVALLAQPPLEAVPGGSRFHRPAPSPDGQRIAFTLECGSRHEAALANLDGTGFRFLTRNDVEDWYPQWSPDGARVVLFRGAEKVGRGRYRIVTIEVATGKETPLTGSGFYDGDPAYAPDRHIVFNSDRAGNHDVWIMEADGTHPRPLTDNPLSDFSPSVHPDGGRLVCVRQEAPGYVLELMDLEGGQRAVLDVGRRDNFKPDWSPDGRSLVFFGPTPGEKPETETSLAVLRFDVEEARLTRLSDGAGSDGDPAWSPDGSEVFFVSDRRGRDELFVMGRDGTDPRSLWSEDTIERISKACSGQR